MDNPLVVSLIVTGIGMAMLFLALAILYGLMVLMTEVIRDRGSGSSDQGSGIRDQGEMEEAAGMEKARWRAAAIGVALARAEQELDASGLPGPAGTVSAWRALHQQRQLSLSLPSRRSR